MTDSSESGAVVEGDPPPAEPSRPPTAPESISVSLRGFDTEEHARAFGHLLAMYVQELSRQIDLSTLDGNLRKNVFIRALTETRPHANELIKAYRLHHNVQKITAEVYGTYGDLMKFTAYHLGNMAGLAAPPSLGSGHVEGGTAEGLPQRHSIVCHPLSA
jgi:hypothetical protein